MAPRVRVRLDPLPSPFASENQTLSDGPRVALEALGPFASTLALNAPAPAKLIFEARYLERVRGEQTPEPEVVPLATLDGKLVRSGSWSQLRFEGNLDAAGAPVGLVPATVVDEDDPPRAAEGDDPKDREQIRVLRFFFDSEQFRNVHPTFMDHGELVVLMKPNRFRYCEISVALEVNGSVEASSEQNDILDVFITMRNPGRRLKFVLRLTDLEGEPLPNARCVLVSGALPEDDTADPNALVADGEGLVRLKGLVGYSSIEVEWRPPDADTPTLRRTLLTNTSEDSQAADERRLNNLGYTEATLRENVFAFQSDFEREPTGRLEDIREELRAWHDDGIRPQGSASA